MTTPAPAPTAEDAAYARMSNLFATCSYVEQYLDKLPSASETYGDDPDYDEDDESPGAVTAAGETSDLLGPEGHELLDYTWQELLAGPDGWESEEIDKPNRGMQPATVLTHEATGRRFIAKECRDRLADAPAAEEDVSTLLRAAGVRGASHAAMSHVDPNVVVSSFAGELEGVQKLIKVRDAVQHPNPTLAEYTEFGIDDMQQLVDIMVCDALVENQDRSGFNLFIGQQQDGSTILLPFDHGGAFGIQKQAPRRDVKGYLSAPGGVLRPALREYAETRDWQEFVAMVTAALQRFKEAAHTAQFVDEKRRGYVISRANAALVDPYATARALLDES